MHVTDKNIQALSGLWYRLVGLDHHKDRDCHWTIELTWSYDRPLKYKVLHGGYVFREIEETVPTLDRARERLVELMDEAFTAEFALATKRLGDLGLSKQDRNGLNRLMALEPEFSRIKQNIERDAARFAQLKKGG